MLCSKIEDGFATVFRQVVLTRFEQTLHAARQDKGELTVEQINGLWLEANRPMHGDVVRLTDGYGWWWLYIGHFIHSPFYCYAYAFGELLVLALVQKYRKQEGRRSSRGATWSCCRRAGRTPGHAAGEDGGGRKRPRLLGVGTAHCWGTW